MPNNLLFVYGSLRRGDYNHSRTGLGEAKYLGTKLIPNFYLRHNGYFPAAFEHGDPDMCIVVDVYDVTDYDTQWIDWMEEGAGYDKTEVMSLDGTRGMMYTMSEDNEEYFRNEVPHNLGISDWIKYKEAA